MEANHKPLWMVERHDQNDGSITYEIWDHNPANYRRVVALNDEFVEEYTHARKDAATIVHAVNSHNDMLEALKQAKRLTDNINEFGACTDAELYDAAWSAIEAAIAKAEATS